MKQALISSCLQNVCDLDHSMHLYFMDYKYLWIIPSG